MVEKDNTQIEHLTPDSVESHLQDCDSSEEAKKLVDYMISNPSRNWLGIMQKAESRSIRHYDILIDSSDDIYASAAEATADADGIVVVQDKE